MMQQIAGGSVIFGSVAEGIGNDQGAGDGRQHFGRFAWREPFRDKLVLAHLEKALHFLRNRFRQILRGGAEHGTRAHVSFGVSSSSEGLLPDTDGIRVFLQLLVDQFGSILRPPTNDGRREILLCREVVVDARALDAHIRGDFPEAEASETALLHAPFGSIHDRSLHVTQRVSLSIDSLCLLKTQLILAYLPIESSARGL